MDTKKYETITELKTEIQKRSIHADITYISVIWIYNMAATFIKAMNFPENSIGQYLYGFFEFYSNFNFGIYSINVSQYNPFILSISVLSTLSEESSSSSILPSHV